MYNPYDWYWLADDGRVYSSKRNIIMDDTDATYLQWQSEWWVGHWRSAWPYDASNNQTKTSMQQVMTPYGITIP